MPYFSPVSTGGGAVPKASTRAGKTIYRFTGSGTITVGVAGTAEILLVGGGGPGANCGGGGGGGILYSATEYLPVGTHTVTVGSGGSLGGYSPSSILGKPSYIQFAGTTGAALVALGGGNGAGSYQISNYVAYQYGAGSGGSAGGGGTTYGSRGGAAANNLIPGQGSSGTSNLYDPSANHYGVPGGSGYAGAGNYAGIYAGATGNGGNGYTTNINGSSVTYAGGGAGGPSGYGGVCGCNNANYNVNYANNGGTGGGGNRTRYDAYRQNSNSGACNTGGGGASVDQSPNYTTGVPGGSGIAIVVVG